MFGQYIDKKNTVEDCHSISTAHLRKHDYFCGYRCGTVSWKNGRGEKIASISLIVCTTDSEYYARFQYTHTCRSTGEKTECDYKVRLVTTPCHLGGIRWWFICPLSHDGVPCGRRVGKLYCPPGGKYYGCRHCYNLSYESRNEPRLARPGGIGYPLVVERRYDELYKQMKRWTYRGKPTRKARRLSALEARSYASIASCLGRLNRP
jgi:hypothetical protein